jgi:AbrB family looped-hinge helix DNA binding protein
MVNLFRRIQFKRHYNSNENHQFKIQNPNFFLKKTSASIILTSKIIFMELKMEVWTTTKMSSKGQVVIPEQIRKRLGLKAGSRFVVVGDKDTVILKAISPPSMEEFNDLIKEARRQAKLAGLKQSDIGSAVAEARGTNESRA